MEKTRRNKLMVRWSILSVIVAGLSLGIGYLINGSIPVVESFKVIGGWNYKLPFIISKLTDLAFVPAFMIWSISIILWGYEKIPKNDKGVFIWFIALYVFLGIVISISSYNVLGFDVIFVISFVMGIVVYFSINVFRNVGLGWGVGIGLIVGMSFGIGISTCFAIGIVAGIFIVFAAILGVLFTEIIKQIFNLSFSKKIGRYLIVEDNGQEEDVE